MCGIIGTYGQAVGDEAVLRAAISRLSHRGPDGSGVWRDPTCGIALGHTRLSILDLSPAGNQPMVSACGRYVMVFNGEIYNHLALRERLGDQAPVWRGHSDTETLLACFSAWGVDETLKATVGMFAIALWDRQTRRLILTRDRLGEKPLYYGYVRGEFVFGSELKALTGLPGFSGDVDRGVLALMVRHCYIPAPYCIFKGFWKLVPGTTVELSVEAISRREVPTPKPYWSAIEVAMAGLANPLAFESDGEAATALEAELSRAVGGQMLADVPLGAFLSGGVDSSLVVALMQAQSSRPVKTFSLGFREGGYDEAHYAGAVARHLGTDHTEFYVSADDARAVIPALPKIYDEPFSDSSQIPTSLVAALARQQVTVALSGDGGDELFGGYNRYFIAAPIWRTIERIPKTVRRALTRSILALPSHTWDKLYRLITPLIPKRRRWQAPGYKLHKGAWLLNSEHDMALYRGLVTHWEPAEIVLGGSEPTTILTGPQLASPTLSERMMLLDVLTYLPDDILAKVDRAAMAVSLETRVPLIDHRVFAFAWRLPLHYKVRDGQGKWLLRQLLYKHVPPNLVDRPKMGFGVPIGAWLRGPLREWAENLLDEDRLRREGYFHPSPIRQRWKEHLSGRRNWQAHLWDVLMFQQWLEHMRAN
jgi:asparagine synthase (glutamine-hydrolysing)